MIFLHSLALLLVDILYNAWDYAIHWLLDFKIRSIVLGINFPFAVDPVMVKGDVVQSLAIYFKVYF